MKKKKTSWKTIAGLVLAASAWRKFSEDLPIDGVIVPIVPPTEGHGVTVKPTAAGRCPQGYYLSGDGTYCVKL